jgi:aminoglycoside phosphotransferase (APT) family kinase protein
MRSDPVTTILAAHGIHDPWFALPATGVANRIYATRDVVLRIATDHPDAIVDAFTESVAAPVAHAAGILTPRLIAFDASHALIDRPYSIWERVHGQTFGLASLSATQSREVWTQVGQQLALLHQTVTACPDPNNYLDTPGRDLDLSELLTEYVNTTQPRAEEIRAIERLIADLQPYITLPEPSPCFLHNDLHDRNLMCGASGGLLALIDWGDAGWGDPVLDFAPIPPAALPFVLEGYGPTARLGPNYEARIRWDQLAHALESGHCPTTIVSPC